MGQSQSSEQIPTEKTLSSTIDYLAANYILTSNFQDLKNLTDPKYCKNLVILTSDVISRYLTERELEFLKQRMEGSVETNKMTTEKIAYFKRDNVDKMDIKSELKKKRMCISVAKYYVKIFHVFNAIAHTINPVYTWKDKFGSTVTVDYEHRNDIPQDAHPTISKVNLCSSRINALMKDKSALDVLKTNQQNTTIDISSKFCDLNLGKSGAQKTLANEPGIPELEALYFDQYDYNSGKFSSMSDEMVKLYNIDLLAFYTLFTGKQTLPSNITKFGDIPLRDYNISRPCAKNGSFRKSYKGTLKEKLFKEYAENVQTMMKNTADNQNKLLAIIDQLFAFIKDPQDPNKKLIVIHPKLDNKLLSKLITDSRQIIVKMYSTCETDFFKGLQLFEAIVEKQIIDTSVAQIKALEQNVEQTISLDSGEETAPIVETALESAPAPLVEHAVEPTPEPVPAVVPVPEPVPAVVPATVVVPAVVPAVATEPVVVPATEPATELVPARVPP
jgi:hypothetical protein